MPTIDFGIGNQIIPLYELADIMEVEEKHLATICTAGGLNLIKMNGCLWVGMWQFRLFMAHILGFQGKVLNFDQPEDTISKVTPQDLRIALGHLVLARSVHKGELMSGVSRMQEKAAQRWAWALENVPRAMASEALDALEQKGLLDAAQHATSKRAR
jgi:hypothetical protein